MKDKSDLFLLNTNMYSNELYLQYTNVSKWDCGMHIFKI